ncbi:hypothetical protein P7C70_g5530, partial [Phenoliferia sp. Uapishka_3]
MADSSTLRSPPPPPPPKPLHLTMSMRGRGSGSNGKKAAGYPKMPTWSRASQPVPLGDDEEDADATIKGAHSGVRTNDAVDGSVASGMEEWLIAKGKLPGAQPLEEMFKAGGGAEFDEPQRRDTRGASESGGSTIRKPRAPKTATLKGKPIRTSIFFDPLLPNPLIDPSTSVPPVPDLSSLHVPVLEESPSSGSATEASGLPRDEASGSLDDEEEGEEHILDLAVAIPAVSLIAFSGVTAFGELSFEAGVALCIEDEDLGGGWSLGYLEVEGEESRGLIPQGWYQLQEVPSTTTEDPEAVRLAATSSQTVVSTTEDVSPTIISGEASETLIAPNTTTPSIPTQPSHSSPDPSMLTAEVDLSIRSSSAPPTPALPSPTLA